MPGMKISTGGVLQRAVKQLKREGRYLAFDLIQLHKHLSELRERTQGPEFTAEQKAAVVDEFFDVWVE